MTTIIKFLEARSNWRFLTGRSLISALATPVVLEIITVRNAFERNLSRSFVTLWSEFLRKQVSFLVSLGVGELE
jgi:hypothetical protein